MNIESTVLGRIVVPDSVPQGYAVFYTTSDFPGRLGDGNAALLTSVVREHFGIDASLSTCNQVHGATLKAAPVSDTAGARWNECDSCDALFTTAEKVALGIKVADCLPITMIDSAHAVIANIHSGWRGAVQKIAVKTLGDLSAQTAFEAADCFAYLGPSIRVCCFEVGEEVVQQFAATHPDIEQFVDRAHKKPHIDLPALTAATLAENGLHDDRIIDSKLCTRCDGSIFHSYRKQGPGGGRNLAVVAR